jgi:hypothetical protein
MICGRILKIIADKISDNNKILFGAKHKTPVISVFIQCIPDEMFSVCY